MKADRSRTRQAPAALAVIVLAAGLGTRMRSKRPKVMHAIAGLPMVGHVLAAVRALRPAETVVVAGPDMPALERAVAPARIAVQRERLGTAHAAAAAMPALKGFDGTVLILFGDTPLLRAGTLRALLAARRAAKAGLAVLGMRPADATGYGRMITDGRGRLERIVEHRDATSAERGVTLCNAGVMAVEAALLRRLLPRIKADNAKGELYLTDLVALVRGAGREVVTAEADAAETIGVDTRAKLAIAEATMQGRLRAAAMEAGVTLIDPQTVWLAHDTRLAPDVTIGPSVWFGPGARIDEGVDILGFCHIEGAHVGRGARIGPFARLRPGAVIGADAHIGNFVEIKAARVAPGAKINHLSYVGDATVGARANIGAGTITCNYDGFAKSVTRIGAEAHIGSNTALVAPVAVGARAIVGAGSVIAENVPADALALTRGPHVAKPGWAARFRARRRTETGKG